MVRSSNTKGTRTAYILLVGIWATILSVIMGILCCLTIIGIPFGIKHFKFIKIIFMPLGTTAAYRPNAKQRVLNICWSFFGGYFERIVFTIATLIFKITSFGTPIALQIDRMYAYIKGPFGAELIEYGKYTHSRNTMYDYTLLQRKICYNPNEHIFDDVKGRPVTVKKYLQRLEDEANAIKRPAQIATFLSLSIALFGVASIALIPWLGILLIAFGVIVAIVMNEYKNIQYLKFYDKNMRRLYKLYGEDAEFDPLPAGIQPGYVFEYLGRIREQSRRDSIRAAAERSAAIKREKEEKEKNKK